MINGGSVYQTDSSKKDDGKGRLTDTDAPVEPRYGIKSEMQIWWDGRNQIRKGKEAQGRPPARDPHGELL